MRTPSPPTRASGAQRVTDAVQARDAGLQLARRAQRWIVALAVGAASALAALTAHAYHARTPSAVTSAAPAQRPGDDGSASSGSTVPAAAVQPPAAAPASAASTAVAPVVSGGS